jgi:hypothetical protein
MIISFLYVAVGAEWNIEIFTLFLFPTRGGQFAISPISIGLCDFLRGCTSRSREGGNTTIVSNDPEKSISTLSHKTGDSYGSPFSLFPFVFELGLGSRRKVQGLVLPLAMSGRRLNCAGFCREVITSLLL